MMDGWRYWDGRKVFLRLKNGRVYSGKIDRVDDSDKTIIFISMIDKFSKKITFVVSEILEIKEEA